MKKDLIFLMPSCLIIILPFLLLTGCNSCMKKDFPHYEQEKYYYYKSFASYIKPFLPVGPISPDEAINIEMAGSSYYMAKYDEDNRISEFWKITRGKREFGEVYHYSNGKIYQSEMVRLGDEKEGGEIKICLYDQEGKITEWKKYHWGDPVIFHEIFYLDNSKLVIQESGIYMELYPRIPGIFIDLHLEKEENIIIVKGYYEYNETERSFRYNLEDFGYSADDIEKIKWFWINPEGESILINFKVEKE